MKRESILGRLLVWLQHSPKTHPKLILIAKIIPVYFFIWLMSYRQLDPDFGWHLQSGIYYRAHGIPYHDLYTYTASSFAWINHEWGSDILLSVLYQIGGYLLTSLVFAALWTIAIFINAGKVAFPILFAAAIALAPYVGVRTMVWTILGLSILIKLASLKNARWRLLIPLLFIPWANLHSGFIVGFLYLGYLSIKEKDVRWWSILLLSALATFINPYGPRLYLETFRTLTDGELHNQITEWHRFYIPNISWLYVAIWMAAFIFFFRKKLKNWLSFPVIMFAATLSATRNLPLFVIASLQDFYVYSRELRAQMPKQLDFTRQLIVIGGVYFTVVMSFTIATLEVLSIHSFESAYPVQAVAYLNEYPCDGHIFNSYNYGGYLIWKLPGQKVYIDGRMPSWRAPDGIKYLDTYFSVLNNAQTRNAQFAQYNVQCVLVVNNSDNNFLITGLVNSGWQTKINANGALLLLAPGYH